MAEADGSKSGLDDPEEPQAFRARARKDELARFHLYRATGDRSVRDAIVADAQGLAIGLARRFRDRGADPSARAGGRNRARRHEGTGAIDIVDRLGHRLRHVGARMKEELHQGNALHVATLDVVNA